MKAVCQHTPYLQNRKKYIIVPDTQVYQIIDKKVREPAKNPAKEITQI